MPETQQRLEFRFLVEVAEDGEIEAYCIDAGAVGVGATILAAITEMVSALEAMYEVVRTTDSMTMYFEPNADDLAVFNKVIADQGGVPETFLGAGVISPRERKERGRRVHIGFDASNLHVRGAA
jgi:hypothetical protein